mmetsp:Transcript_20642/g.50687  ORF Transcript_20642/g.50687 Transcript_20642/m.50687 type:complete len:263 (+) Transcript_20642:140-928(+)
MIPYHCCIHHGLFHVHCGVRDHLFRDLFPHGLESLDHHPPSYRAHHRIHLHMDQEVLLDHRSRDFHSDLACACWEACHQVALDKRDSHVFLQEQLASVVGFQQTDPGIVALVDAFAFHQPRNRLVGVEHCTAFGIAVGVRFVAKNHLVAVVAIQIRLLQPLLVQVLQQLRPLLQLEWQLERVRRVAAVGSALGPFEDPSIDIEERSAFPGIEDSSLASFLVVPLDQGACSAEVAWVVHAFAHLDQHVEAGLLGQQSCCLRLA